MEARMFQTLNTAGVIDHVQIWRNPDHNGAWSIYAYGADNRHLGVESGIEAARGGVRTWASLDTAYGFLLGLGWVHDVCISA